MDEARENYLNRVVKKEALDDTEVNCTAGKSTADVVVKSEPMDLDTADDNVDPPKLEDDLQEKYLLEIEENLQKNSSPEIEDDFRENDLPEMKYEIEFDEDEEFDLEETIDENSTVCDEPEETTDAPAKANEFTPSRVIVLPRIVDVQSVNKSLARVTKAQDSPHISKSMNMTCEKCDLPIKTLSALIKHYQEEHKEERIQMKCCSTKLKIHELLDHMEYHKNPEKYRCGKHGIVFELCLLKYLVCDFDFVGVLAVSENSRCRKISTCTWTNVVHYRSFVMTRPSLKYIFCATCADNQSTHYPRQLITIRSSIQINSVLCVAAIANSH